VTASAASALLPCAVKTPARMLSRTPQLPIVIGSTPAMSASNTETVAAANEASAPRSRASSQTMRQGISWTGKDTAISHSQSPAPVRILRAA